jgi:hypothetical protein
MDLERLSDSDVFKNGYFYSTVMVPGKVPKKGGLNTAKPALKFKPPKDRDTPVLVVMVPYKDYVEYLDWVAQLEVRSCRPCSLLGNGTQHFVLIRTHWTRKSL